MLKEIETPIPPFPALLTHNYPPSNTEKLLIRETLSGLYTQISRIDEELARLQSAKEKLKQFREVHEGVISPLRRVPNEILSEIMKFYWAGHYNKGSKQSQSSAMLLASVCSSWRAVALSIPQLWTVLAVADQALNHPLLTRTILSRSGDCSLDVYAWWEMSGWEDNPNIQGFGECMKHHIHRLKRLFANAYRPLLPLLGFDGPFMRLKDIELYFPINEHELFQFLKACPNLEDANLEIYVDRSVTRALPPLNIPNLRTLYLNYDGDPTNFFKHITTPNLVELSTNMIGSQRWPMINVGDFIYQSKCSMKKLDLGFSEANPAEMLQMLDAVPLLEELSMNELQETTEAVLDYLMVGTGRLTRLRKLKTFSIHDEMEYYSPSYLHVMLASRAAEFPIRKLLLNIQGEVPSGKTLLMVFGRLIDSAGSLGYTLEFQDDDNSVLDFKLWGK